MKRLATLLIAAGALAVALVAVSSDPASAGWRRHAGWGYYGAGAGVYVAPGRGYYGYRPYGHYRGYYPYAYYPYWRGRRWR